MDHSKCNDRRRGEPWNKGKLAGQKAPLRLKEIWAIRIRLQLAGRVRELALFNLAIDSKLRSCDLVRLHVRDIVSEVIAAGPEQRPAPVVPAAGAALPRQCPKDILFTRDDESPWRVGSRNPTAA